MFSEFLKEHFHELKKACKKIRSTPNAYKETVITENTYKAIPYKILKTYFLPKGLF